MVVKSASWKTAAALLGSGLAFSVAGRPASAQVSIPLQYVPLPANNPSAYRLAINVGINGGSSQIYIFDTGSALFNAAYNPATWNGYSTGTTSNGAPSAAGYARAYDYAYTASGYRGNLVPMPQLSFYAPGASTPAAVLSATPGYVMGAVYQNYNSGGTTDFPTWFSTNTGGPVTGGFYGTFGAANFATQLVSTVSGGGTTVVGGVLGQAIVGNMAAQGYVVSANGQTNPTNAALGLSNAPASGTATVRIGGSSQAVTACNPCVTVGLTAQIMGQFLPVGLPSANPTGAGAIPVTLGPYKFPNPNGGVGNNASTEFGANARSTLNGQTASTPALFDSGTADIGLPGLTGTGRLTVVGTNQQGQMVVGLPISALTVTSGASPTTYNANSGYTNTVIGISFFMQNSVMYDLTDNLLSYTPYFVTVDPLATTAGGDLVVGATTVPLGLAGVVSGAGGLTIQSGGNAQLSAANTYTGATTIESGGTLLVSGQGSIAQSSGVANNGTLDISRAWSAVSIKSLTGSGQVNLGGQNLVITNASGTFSGTIGDGGSYNATGGSLTVSGGAFTFAGTGTYTGGTLVSGGSMTIAGGGSIVGGVTVNSGASFVNNGTVTAPGLTHVNQGNLTNSGALIGNFTNSGTATNTGTITGLVTNARSGSFKNNATVVGSVINSGLLSGNATITGDLVNDGVSSPGNSPGTIRVGGNYFMTANSVHLIDVVGSGISDRIFVGGVATLAGPVIVNALPDAVFPASKTYTFLTAAGGINGTFSTVAEPYPFMLSSLSYDANNVYLTMQIGGFAAAAVTPLQAAVGAVLDANVGNATGDFAQVLSTIAINTVSDAQAQATLQALSGNNYAGFSTAMVQGAQLFMNNFASQAGGGGAPGSTRVALAEACDVACDIVSAPKWGAWGGGLGGLGTIGANQAVGGVTYNAGGFAAGLDRLVTDTLRLGVTAGYAAGTQWVSGFNGIGRSDTWQAGLYANYAQDKVYADALVGYAYSYNQMWRSLVLPGLQRLALGQTGANQWYGQLETGYRFDIGTNANAYVTPFARLQAYSGTQNGFTESGAQSLNLTIGGQTTNSLRTVLGAQIGGSMDLGWREPLAMQFRLGWSHEYADVSRPVTATLAGAPAMPFTTWGVSPQRDGAVIGLSANTAVAEATSVYLRYEGNISGQDNMHAITGGVRMSW